MDKLAEKFPRLLRKNHKGEYGWSKDSPYFDGGWEARFLRYTYEAKAAEFIWDPAHGDVRVESKAAGKVSLFDGKTHLAWMLPDKDGWALPIPMKTPDIEFKVRVQLKGEVSGFVGAVGELAAEAVVDWSVKGNEPEGGKCPVELGLGGGLNAFAGAMVTGSLGIGLEWFNLKERRWKQLTAIRGEATGFVGVAVQYTFRIGWDPERQTFVFELRAGLALKVGFGAGLRGEVDVNEIFEFVGGLLEHTDFQRIHEITGAAFDQFTRLCVATAVEAVEEVTDAVYSRVMSVADTFASWSGEQDEIRQLSENILSGRAKVLLRSGSPEAKAAVISKLCDRSGFLSDESEEEAILTVLESLGTERGLRKTLERVTPQGTIEAAIRKIDSGVDWAEQDRFDRLLEQFGIER